MTAQEKAKGSTEAQPRQVDPLDKYTALAVRGAIISTGLVGLAIYVRNSALFARFQHVSQIPLSIAQKQTELKGVVRAVTPSGLLKVEHVPSIRLPWPLVSKRPDNVGLLNLRLAGVDVSPASLDYLQKDFRVENRRVNFTIIKPTQGNSDCMDVELTAKKNLLSHVNLNADLVRRGHARVLSPEQPDQKKAIQENAAYSRLVSRLLTCEQVANRRSIGIWERNTWVESVESLPSAFGAMVRGSAVTKLVVLLFHVLQDVVTFTLRALKQGYILVRTLTGYLCIAYRSFSSGVTRLAHLYAAQKNRLMLKKPDVKNNSQS